MYMCSIAESFSKIIKIIIDLLGPGGFVLLVIFLEFFVSFFVISSFIDGSDVK